MDCDHSEVMLVQEDGGEVNHRWGDITGTQWSTAESNFYALTS